MNTKEERLEKVNAQLQSLFNEISVLTKKKPDSLINKLKMKIINSIIEEAIAVLGKENIPLMDFKGFSDNDLPSNSDVTIVCGQYLSCLRKFRSDNIKQKGRL